MTNIESKRFPSKSDSLRTLRKLGVDFTCVVDVGVQNCTKELIEVFPDLRHYLFEPVPNYISGIRKNYEQLDYKIFQVAVSDTDGLGELIVRSSDNSGKVTHSQVNYGQHVGKPEGGRGTVIEKIPVPLVRLSSIIREQDLAGPILLKIDVDGHESSILSGLKGAEQRVGCVVVEAPLANVVGRSHSLQSMGFVLWDIVDLCYYKGCLWQVDLVFLSRELADQPELRGLSAGGSIDWSAWYPFAEEQ